MKSCAAFLGADGPLARQNAHYEPRGTQIEMAEAVARAINDERVLICEAGTGTGKTLAYLLPALLSGKRVIVSTATRALQEQIVNHDLPWIARALDLAPSVAVMKGLSNYVCKRRLLERREGVSSRGRMSTSLRKIVDFSSRSNTGDIGHLPELSEDDPEWPEVVASSETRLGQSCSFYETCHVTQMRRQAEQAQLVIVNHHLYFADLALRGAHPGRILPNHDVVIFDEAHQLEEIATDFFGTRVSSQAVMRMASDLARAISYAGEHGLAHSDFGLHALNLQLRNAVDEFFRCVGRCVIPGEGKLEVDTELLKAEARVAWIDLDSALENLNGVSQLLQASLYGSRQSLEGRAASIKDSIEIIGRRIADARTKLQELMEANRGRVVWTEKTERGASITSAPVDMADTLRVRIFETVPSIVLTSATLTTFKRLTDVEASSPFTYFRARLGLVDLLTPVDELIVPSPFNYRQNAVLYTPRDLPPPNTAQFIEQASDRILSLIRLTQGGAFVLTTSIRSMHAMYERLNAALELPVLVQGALPKSELLDRFRLMGNAVLVATSSFWEGVDVAGAALRLVVLEKVPFLVPTDPLVKARSMILESQGRNPFTDYLLPAAAIALKQGFGRLIRSSHDRGIVALLDERVHRRGYGQRLLSNLPNAQRATKLDEVVRFWEQVTSSPAGTTRRI